MKSTNSKSPVSIGNCMFLASIIFLVLFFIETIVVEKPIVSFIFLLFVGWLIWTFTEYFIHRFLMHDMILQGSKDNLFHHQKHHQSPQNLKINSFHRLIFLLIFLLSLTLSIQYGGYTVLLAGFIFGFTSYNFLHYLLHQPFGKYFLPKVQRAHILHHFHRPNQGFSFSTSFWDWLFRTQPSKTDKITKAMLSKYFSHSSKRTVKKQPKTILSLLVFSGQLALMTSCVPVFSDMQSARTLGKGNVEGTPYYTNSGADADNKGVSHASVNFGVGLSENVDIRARLSYLWFNGEGGGTTIFGIGPKFSLVPERLSFFLPIGGSSSWETWQTQPTIFYSQPIVKNRFEATISPKYILNFCEDCTGLFATNLGIAISKDLSKNALRLEYGRVFVEGGGVGQFSFGYSFTLNKKPH